MQLWNKSGVLKLIYLLYNSYMCHSHIIYNQYMCHSHIINNQYMCHSHIINNQKIIFLHIFTKLIKIIESIKMKYFLTGWSFCYSKDIFS